MRERRPSLRGGRVSFARRSSKKQKFEYGTESREINKLILTSVSLNPNGYVIVLQALSAIILYSLSRVSPKLLSSAEKTALF